MTKQSIKEELIMKNYQLSVIAKNEAIYYTTVRK